MGLRLTFYVMFTMHLFVWQILPLFSISLFTFVSNFQVERSALIGEQIARERISPIPLQQCRLNALFSQAICNMRMFVL
jgi:hypothetical protein